jgi:hypothetical protein
MRNLNENLSMENSNGKTEQSDAELNDNNKKLCENIFIDFPQTKKC